MSIPEYVREFIDNTINNEGGYQADPQDTGNIVQANGRVIGTNYGITPAALAAYKGVPVSTITESDMRNLTQRDASDIYERDYWTGPRLDQIEDNKLAENVFDMAVNAGPSRAIKLLQDAAGTTTDGVLGPQTLDAVKNNKINTNNYSDQRINFYHTIAAADPTKEKYLNGWSRRAMDYYDNTAFDSKATPDYLGSAIKEMYQGKDDLWADPVAKEYTVKKGDTLTSIAKNMGVSIADLVDGNEITNPNQIQVGQRLLY